MMASAELVEEVNLGTNIFIYNKEQVADIVTKENNTCFT